MRTYYSYCLAVVLLAGTLKAQAYDAQTIRDYVDRYKYIAVDEMESHGIPASITLAQGILESGAGTSELAAKSNNHFGIKCHKGWTGGKVYYDDDAKGECFRKYRNPEASFKDHSAFLTTRGRYAFLFDLKRTDYKGWARGLKKAGYATNPQYANLLIRLIEDYSLATYDRGLPAGQLATVSADKGKGKEVAIDTRTPKAVSEVFHYNRIKTVKVRKGDTPEKLANEHGIRLSWLLRYNNLLRGDESLEAGTHFYLQPKRRKGMNKYHVVKPGETMASISRDEGILLDMLYKRNLVDRGFEPAAGEQLYLRKNRLNPPASAGNERAVPPVKKPSKISPQELALPEKTAAKKDEPKVKKQPTVPVSEPRETETKIKPETAGTIPTKTERKEEVAVQPAPRAPEKVAVEKPVEKTPVESITYDPVYHSVKAGENLYRISLKYNTTVEEIMRLNGLSNHSIGAGQRLRVR